MVVAVTLSDSTPDPRTDIRVVASGLVASKDHAILIAGVGKSSAIVRSDPGGGFTCGRYIPSSTGIKTIALIRRDTGAIVWSDTINVGSVTPPADPTAPGTPTGLALTAGDASISARCTAPSADGGSPITAYSWKLNGAVVATTPGPAYVFTGLTNGTSYTVAVAATNAVGTSSYTSTASATPAASAPGPEPGGEPAEGSAGQLAALIAAASSGATISLPDRIFREYPTGVTKNLTLAASDTGKAEIRGSDIWTGWSGTGPWTSSNTVPSMPMAGGGDGRYSGSMWNPRFSSSHPEQVFVDGEPFVQVDPGLPVAAGQFKIDATRHVVLGTNPSGKRVEVTVRRGWWQGSGNLTLHGLFCRHAGNDAQTEFAALRLNGGRLVMDDGTRLMHCHATLVGVLGGTDHQWTDVLLDHAGQLGYAATSGVNGLHMQRVEIAHANDQYYNPFWEAGAGKVTHTTAVVLEGMDVHHIVGNGPWWDIGPNNGAVLRQSKIHHCDFAGVHFEISSGGLFEDLAIWECGWGDPRSASQSSWPWGAAVLISTSAHATARRVTAAWNRGGIAFINQPRSDAQADHGSYLQQSDNVVAARPADYLLAGVQDYAGNLFTDASNKGGTALGGGAAGGKYYTGGAMRFAWNNGERDLAAINATAIEEGGSAITQSAMAALLTAAGIPTTGTH